MNRHLNAIHSRPLQRLPKDHEIFAGNSTRHQYCNRKNCKFLKQKVQTKGIHICIFYRSELVERWKKVFQNEVFLDRILVRRNSNLNESYHSSVFRIIPKGTMWSGERVKVACLLAAIITNEGHIGLVNFLKSMDFNISGPLYRVAYGSSSLLTEGHMPTICPRMPRTCPTWVVHGLPMTV